MRPRRARPGVQSWPRWRGHLARHPQGHQRGGNGQCGDAGRDVPLDRGYRRSGRACTSCRPPLRTSPRCGPSSSSGGPSCSSPCRSRSRSARCNGPEAALRSSSTGEPAGTGSTTWDALASASIGLILIGVALVLALDNYSLLLESLPPATASTASWRPPRPTGRCRGLRGLRTMPLGPTSLRRARDRFRGRDLRVRGGTGQRPAAPRRGRGGGRGGDPRLVVVDPRARARARRGSPSVSFLQGRSRQRPPRN